MIDSDFDEREILKGLKTFQRRTVDYVFRRLYLDPNPTPRFLIADEVGLGKTMVARGIIARTIKHLRESAKTKRIDIVYVCSNAAIAKQNINRLNVFRDEQFELATRLTMLPTVLHTLQERSINFVSFTPSTTFDLQSRGGMQGERLLLFHMLKGRFDLPESALRSALRGSVNPVNWNDRIREWNEPIEDSLRLRFLKELEKHPTLLQKLRELCQALSATRGAGVKALRHQSYEVIGELRSLLARVCVEALEPDLIILDEFQRFRDLLETNEPSEAAQLAQALMKYRDDATKLDARILLLSATPYRMYTLAQEEDENHYRDFIKTVRFLVQEDDEAVGALERDLMMFRQGLLVEGQGAGVDGARERIEACLRSVMVRTERVGATLLGDSMMRELKQKPLLPRSDELLGAVALSAVARAVEARDVIEYWKSSPYLLNFMRGDGYKLKKDLVHHRLAPSEELIDALEAARPYLLSQEGFARYKSLDPGNARMRALVEETIEGGQWQWLWMPPSLPYIEPGESYRSDIHQTKSLVFSAWTVVPDVISAICSYEAERRMLAADPDLPAYAELHEKRAASLQYRVDKSEGESRMSGMMTVALFYPCRALARIADPLQIAISVSRDLPRQDEVRARAQSQVREALLATGKWTSSPTGGRVDQRWYWAALALLDARHSPVAGEWVASKGGWQSLETDESGHHGSGFNQHCEELARAFELPDDALGRPPDDLVEVLADLALAGPGTCALRSLMRLASDEARDGIEILNAAATIAEGLRTLFNQPTAMSLLRESDSAIPYWRRVLSYGLSGNLQSVLDEYVHILREVSGHSGRGDADTLADIADAAAEALSMRTSRISVDEIHLDRTQGTFETSRFNLRTRFALRFGDLKDDNGQVLARVGSVRQAFNSPFPPFILASTSIGQEGLDFHCYCHAVYHWNLPTNPVDLEQREGRVHRFKGHAVRKNIAHDLGLRALREYWDGVGDPWLVLFDRAAAQTKSSYGDLIPYWLYGTETEGLARVERRVPMLTMSREPEQLRRLKKGLVRYRMAFGQPRQQELVEYLEGKDETKLPRVISLAPPEC